MAPVDDRDGPETPPLDRAGMVRAVWTIRVDRPHVSPFPRLLCLIRSGRIERYDTRSPIEREATRAVQAKAHAETP